MLGIDKAVATGEGFRNLKSKITEKCFSNYKLS